MRHQVVLSLERAVPAEPRHARVAVPVGHQHVAAVAQLDRARRLAKVPGAAAGHAPLAERLQDGAVSAAELGRGVRPGVGDPHGAVAVRGDHVGHPEGERLPAAPLQDLSGVLVDPQQQRPVAVAVWDRLRVAEVAPVGAREGRRVPRAGPAAEDPGGAVAGAGDGGDLSHLRRRPGRGARGPVADAPRRGRGPHRRVLRDDVARQAPVLGPGQAAGAVRVGGGDGAPAAGVEGAELGPAHHVHVAPVFFCFFWRFFFF